MNIRERKTVRYGSLETQAGKIACWALVWTSECG